MDVDAELSPGKVKREDSSDGEPLAIKSKVNGTSGVKRNQAIANDSSDLSSEDDKPLAKRVKSNGAQARSAPVKPKVESDSDSDSEDDKPLARKSSARTAKTTPVPNTTTTADARPKRESAVAASKLKMKEEDSSASDSEDDMPLKKRAKSVSSTPAKKGGLSRATSTASTPRLKETSTSAEAAGEDEDEQGGEGVDAEKWKQMTEGDGSIRWTRLEHNGVTFPPPYQPLPKNVKMKYDGKPLELPPESEEVAYFYAQMLETPHVNPDEVTRSKLKDPDLFKKNFFNDFKDILRKHPPRDGTKVTSLEKCDFRPMWEYWEEEKAKKKSMTAAQKKALKQAKDEIEKPYTHCLMDGKEEKVGNFRLEPPSLFRGRGDHPKRGKVKQRIMPEQITINIGRETKVPEPPAGHRWASVIHNQTVTWLAHWKENINGNAKYVFLAPTSTIKARSDEAKYEKARELKKHIERIRRDYTNNLSNKIMKDRQLATAVYFIDQYALRAGNEKGEDEADTVGCCSLKREHLTLYPGAGPDGKDQIKLEFLGKDSIRYVNTITVEKRIFKNLVHFLQTTDEKGRKGQKSEGDLIFDRVSTTDVNKWLQSHMAGLTAKVFRTYNASVTMERELGALTQADATEAEKVLAYNRANRRVAILCNHQRTVAASHAQGMQKMTDRLRALKYERRKLRHQLHKLTTDQKDAKADNKPESGDKKLVKDAESDLDDEWIAQYEDNLYEQKTEKLKAKFEKDQVLKAEDDDKRMTKEQLDEKLGALKEEFARLKKERGKTKADGGVSAASVRKKLATMDKRIEKFRTQMTDKDENKETSLGTSKMNYIDPRITFAWCKKYDVPISRVFAKTLQDKFAWAKDVDEGYKF